MANTRQTPAARAAQAAENEALGKLNQVAFKGETYHVPPTTQWDMSILKSLRENEYDLVVEAALGAKQWERFCKKPRTIQDLIDMLGAVGAEVGTGNFSASARP